MNDFHLFDDASGDGGRVDPDLALITAYLARELSQVQIVAVQDRFANDPAFRAKAQPIIDWWSLPGSWVPSGNAGQSSLTRGEIDAGWQRHVADIARKPEPVLARAPQRRAFPAPGTRSMRRIAAVIAIIVLPMVGLAQLVSYAASNPSAPGHELARAIVPPVLRPSDERVGQALPLADGGQQGVPVIDLTTPAAKAAQTFAAILGINESRDGHVLVNDAVTRRLYLLDRSLAVVSVPLDSTPGSAVSYPGYNNPVRFALVPWVDDSAAMSSGTGPILNVLDGRGRVVRAVDVRLGSAMLATNRNGRFDPMGRALIAMPPERSSRGAEPVTLPGSAFLVEPPSTRPDGASGRSGNAPDADRTVMMPMRGDSIPLHRVDLEARRVDTVAYLKRPVGQAGFEQFGGGRLVIGYGRDGKPTSVRQVINPVEAVDTWSVLSDGTVAIVRAHDYHVDWIRPGGTKSASPKIPYDPRPITGADKQRLVDSTRACLDSADAWTRPAMSARLAVLGAGSRGTPMPDLSTVPPRPACMGTGFIGMKGAPNIPDGISLSRTIRYEIVPLDQIADYYPPFRESAALGDEDGNLWILPRSTTLSRQGELVYDVVTPERGLVRRVRLPVGRSIAGFGKGAVYLQVGNLRDGFILERYVVPR